MTTTALGNHISPPPESTPSPWSWLPGPVFPNYQPAAVGGHQSVRSRKLWGSEVLFAKGALLAPGRADVIIRTTLSLPAPQKNTHERVRAALRTMRWNHPSIASHVAWDKDFVEGKFVYEAPKDETAVSHWLDQVTFLRQAGEEGVEKATDGLLSELASLSTKRTGYELKLYHVTPSSSETSGTRNRERHEIVMYFRHELFDGVAAWEAVGIYLSELAATLGAPSGTSSLEWGKELERLARPVPDRAGPAAQWSPKDLHGDWPLIQRVKGVIARPGVSTPLPRLAAPLRFYLTYIRTERLRRPVPDPAGQTVWYVVQDHQVLRGDLQRSVACRARPRRQAFRHAVCDEPHRVHARIAASSHGRGRASDHATVQRGEPASELEHARAD